MGWFRRRCQRDAAGTDLDGDGKQEVWTTHYNVPGYKGGLGGMAFTVLSMLELIH